MGENEEYVRAQVDIAWRARWGTSPGPGADPIRWVNENAEAVVGMLAAQREALIHLAQRVDRLQSQQ
jgi:hypothetical protein